MNDKISLALDNGLEWLLNSGIQNKSQGPSRGGFSAWYDADNNQNSFVYSEITGYALNLLIFLDQRKNDSRIKKSINLARDYLVINAFDDYFGAVRCRYLEEGNWLDNFCTFDNAIIANSLVNKYRYDSDQEALDKAIIIINTIMNKLYRKGSFFARYITKEERYQDEEVKWSTTFGSFQSKLSLPFLNLYDVTKESKYLDFSNYILKIIAKKQLSSGQFITCNKTKTTFSHPLLYTVEGFLAASLYLQEKTYSEVVESTLKWLSKFEMSNGGISGFHTPSKVINLDSPDINSQYLRCIYLSNFGLDKSISLSPIIDRIINSQLKKGQGKRLEGGFLMGDIWFYDQESFMKKDNKNHINTWATIFALNSLYYIIHEDTNPFSIC